MFKLNAMEAKKMTKKKRRKNKNQKAKDGSRSVKKDTEKVTEKHFDCYQ